MSEDAPEVPEGSEQFDVADELESLVDRGVEDPLDEGYSPPENWSAGEGFGNTPYEELVGETLDQRIAQEEPEIPVDVIDSDVDREYGQRHCGGRGSRRAPGAGRRCQPIRYRRRH